MKFIVIVRESGTVELDYSLEFEAPEVPQIGSYISINRHDQREVGEDMIVRHVWWRLNHPETEPFGERKIVGSTTEIFVECDPALGPYSSHTWRERLEKARDRGIDIEDFQLDRTPLMGRPNL